MTATPPITNGVRRPSPPRGRRSLHSPTASGTAKPAAAFTSMTAPISAGECEIRSSRTGTYVVVARAREPDAHLGEAEGGEERERCARQPAHAAIFRSPCSTRTDAVVVPSTSESQTIGTGVVRTASCAGVTVTLRRPRSVPR